VFEARVVIVSADKARSHTLAGFVLARHWTWLFEKKQNPRFNTGIHRVEVRNL
jgi:hypothetical protein